MSKSSVSALTLAHRFIREHVAPGDLCIDATAGRGGDTALLCRLAGPAGRVLSFDIQQEALDSTAKLLAEQNLSPVAQLILDSHSHMDRYAGEGSVSCITFNFGWLPGGDHSLTTKAVTSVSAVEQGLRLLRPGGVMSLCLYYGRDCGFAERDALLQYLETVDFRQYTVVVSQFANRPNNPPIPVFITRDG